MRPSGVRRFAGPALLVSGLLLAVTLTGAPAALALCPPTDPPTNPPPPLQATLKFQSAPANATFSPAAPPKFVLQIENCSGGEVLTTDGFSSTDFFRFLQFTGPKGGVINANQASISGLVTLHVVNKTLYCLSREGTPPITLSPSIPVVPVEALPGPPARFFREYLIDGGTFYDLKTAGLYLVNAKIDLVTFVTGDRIVDCLQFPGTTLVNVTAPTRSFTVVSNTLQFVIGSLLDHIKISPATSSIASGGTEFFTAQAFDASNNSLGDVTSTTTFGIGPNGSCTGNTCTATAPGSHTVTGTNSGKTATATLTVASPANEVRVWVGLADSNDVGLRFDLKAVLMKNGSQVGSGQLGSVSGGSSGFNNAILEKIPIFSASGPVSLAAGDTLEVLVRNACAKSGKISGAARLWFDGKNIDTGPARDAGSRLDPPSGATNRLFLRSGFALRSTAGSARIFVDKPVGAKCGPYQSFGVWSKVP